jgi:hypothetical protein
MAACCKTKLPPKYIGQLLLWKLLQVVRCLTDLSSWKVTKLRATSNSKLTNYTSLEAWAFLWFWGPKYFKFGEFILQRDWYSNLRTVKTYSSRNIRSVDIHLCNLCQSSLNINTSSFRCKIVIVAQLHLPYLSQAHTTWEETRIYQ